MALPKNEWQLLLKQISLNDINIGDKLNLSSSRLFQIIFFNFFFLKKIFFFLDRLLEDNLIDLLKVLKNTRFLCTNQINPSQNFPRNGLIWFKKKI